MMTDTNVEPELPSQWAHVLHYEAAVDIVSSLMAQCTAVQCSAERAADLVVRQDMRSLRRAYLAELSELDPRNTTAVARTIREYGTLLAGKVEAPRLHLPTRDELHAYRLDRVTHAAVFQDRIAPETLGTSHPRKQPVVVIVTGPPGSGKTTALRCRYRSWDGAAPVLIDPGIYSAYHPRSWDLILAGDMRAGAAVEADVLEWAAMAVGHAIGGRSDVLLAVGTGRPADIDTYTASFRNAGYRVETQNAAIPEAVRDHALTVRHHCRRGNWPVLDV